MTTNVPAEAAPARTTDSAKPAKITPHPTRCRTVGEPAALAGCGGACSACAG